LRAGLIFAVLLMSSPAMAVCVLGAGDCPPTAEDVQEFIAQKVEKHSAGRMKLLSIEKLDGRPGEMYELVYNALLEFTEDAYWSPKVRPFYRTFGVDVQLLSEDFKLFKKGQKVKFKAVVAVEKYESGWKPFATRDYRDDIIR
jgi:hypothetical protein